MPNQQTVDYPSFKLVIVGDGGTGINLSSSKLCAVKSFSGFFIWFLCFVLICSDFLWHFDFSFKRKVGFFIKRLNFSVVCNLGF